MTRRELLSMLMKTGISLPLLNQLSLNNLIAGDEPFTLQNELPPIKDRIIVMIRMFGGNDGLNTLVPYNDPLYYKFRKEDSIINCSIDESQVIKTTKYDSFGFHPQCKDLNDLLSENKLAIIQNVGYPNYDLSHFRSTDIWLTGTDSNIFELSGWLGRYLEQKYPNFIENIPEFPPAIEFGTSVSRILLGKYLPMGFAYLGENFVPDDDKKINQNLTKSQIEQSYIKNIQMQSHKFLKKLNEVEANIIDNIEKYPENNYIADHLSHIARLVSSGLGTNIYSVNTFNMFDNHEYLLDYHSQAIKLASEAVGAFHRDLDKLGIADRVITVLYSEFSRRVAPNGTGTDHGAAGPMFIIGNNVNSGMYGRDPNLADLDNNGNLKYEYDFRQVYISLLSDWFEEKYSLIYPYIVNHNMNKINFVTKNNEKVNFNVYPNPCNNFINISFEFNPIDKIEIFDLKGNIINGFRINGIHSPLVTIDTQQFSNGIYFIKVQSQSQSYYGKFVKA